MSRNKCFVCTGEIQNGISESDISSSEENSILLCKILELPDLEGNETKNFEGRKISYCRLCLNKILNIRDMLEELERLEKKVLDEKYSIELELKDKDNSQGKNSSEDKLRGQIVKELRAASIGSMLDKIRKKRVGQRRNARGSHHVRIMESVTIPNIMCETIQPISLDQRPTGNNVFALEDSQSQLVDKHAFLPNSQSLMMMRSEDSETQLEDIANQKPLTANNSETSCVLEDEECDIKYEMRSDEDMTIDPLYSDLEHLDYPQQNDLIPEISAKLEVGDLPNVTKFSDAQQTTSTTAEHEDPPSHKNFICGTCGAGFVSYNQLRIHDRLHLSDVNGRSTLKNNRRKGGKSRPNINNRSPKKCEECGKVLSSNQKLTHHVMSIHRGQYKFKCTLCDYGCQMSSHLRAHITSVHSVSTEDLKCSKCDRVFKSKRACSVHLFNCSMEHQ